MDRFQELSVFVAVAEEEGFTAASRRLQMSPPPVTRAITSLEKRRGVTRLINRTTRYVRLTDADERNLEDGRRILAELETADETAAGINSMPSGLLSITAALLFKKLHVIPGVVDYLQR